MIDWTISVGTILHAISMAIVIVSAWFALRAKMDLQAHLLVALRDELHTVGVRIMTLETRQVEQGQALYRVMGQMNAESGRES